MGRGVADPAEVAMVLVVDDDILIVEVLRKWLEKEGFDVGVCHDGQAAYEALRASRCDCMLLDVHMPLIGGVELLLLMQAEGIQVPTIVMAGSGDYDEEEMKQFQNVVAYLPKPFEMQHMIDTVRGVTGTRIPVTEQ
jgi:DNA-binding NtrC family response regulator